MSTGYAFTEHSAYMECKNNKSNKFYEVTIMRGTNNQYRIMCRWGRIGSPGRTEMKNDPYITLSHAQIALQVIINEKLNKGYKISQKPTRGSQVVKEARRRGEETIDDILLNRFGDLL